MNFYFKNTFSSSKQNTVKLPFCPEIRYFISEGSKCQTLFANCEGFYPRRIIKEEEKTVLKEFIYNTMYYNEFQNHKRQEEIDREHHVHQIFNSMSLLSQRYNLDGEIHFSVVWVYYFEYETKAMKAIPVFKIFKKKSENEAVFLDFFLNTYENWDCYLKTAEFPESFLCVPRHGEYNFDNESGLLLLEFVRSVRLEENKNKWHAKIAPPLGSYSEVVVRPLFLKVKTFTAEKKKQIMQFIHTLCSYWEECKGSLTNVALFIFILFIKIKETPLQFSSLIWKDIFNQGFMLLNTFIAGTDCVNFFERSFWLNKQMTSIPGIMTSSEAQKTAENVDDEKTRFIELLRSPNKKWVEILDSFCSLFRRSDPFLRGILCLIPNCSALKYLYLLLQAVEKIVSVVIYAKNYTSTSTENDTMKITEKPGKKSNLTENQVLQVWTHSSDSQIIHDPIRRVTFEKVQEIMSNLSVLETADSNKIYGRLSEESINEALKSCPFNFSCINVDETDGYGIYLFPKASLPRLKVILCQLLGRDFYLKSQNAWIFEVLDEFDKSFGTVFFPTELSAVGLFPLKAIVGRL